MIACAYTAEMFWLAMGIGLICVIVALYESHRHDNQERSLLELLRTAERERDYAVTEAELVRTDPRDWRTR